MKVLSFVSRFKKDSAPSLLKTGAQTGINLLFRKRLSRASWLVRAIVPEVLRSAAGTVVDKLRDKIAARRGE